MKVDYLSLLSKTDIPFEEAGLIIHQPTIKEISYVGQEKFFTGCEFLNISKQKIQLKQDKNRLAQLNDFDILMAVLNNQEKNKMCLQMILFLVFPDYTINFLPSCIMISKDKQRHLIDRDNFQSFRKIINQIFCLSDMLGKEQDKYNPGGPQAKALVQKFKRRQKKLMQLKNKGKKQKVEIFSRYISILAVGEQKNMNDLLQYSVFQLFDEFQRFKLRQDFKMYVDCKLAGAKDIEDVKNWMNDLYL